ncbi:hypothetical protein BDF20DRAFT_640780 [Mycotypha africana]|uniref:uncharacterized protein n=1 Tax=Mycotypha africana TaxID=64632 RepID=UPI002300BFE1|nr:uncharacterized protein BDF20DRAFT_640780 [Mycotypha africana]KAI8973290.1 hypothetical protein BDF20DRAFT_640780 [Mycotypha africana]
MQKRKAIDNVSASTAIELKAEVAQHLEQFEKLRATQGKQTTAKRPDKKPTVWSRQNKGVQERNQRDEKHHLEAIESNTLAKSREQLERKAKIYEAMQRGEYEFDIDSVDEDEMPLIDFDKKYLQERELEEKRNSKKRRIEEEEDNDPWIEYVDEFGRTRIVRRSEVPDLKQEEIEDEGTDEDDYDSEEERKKHISQERIRAAERTDMNHYEADREIRTKGVGFYQFAKDEEERQRQLDKLNKLRAETENARQSAASAASKRKQMLAKNADKIRARKAVLQAKKNQKLKSDTNSNAIETAAVNITEDSVNSFLTSLRKQME